MLTGSWQLAEAKAHAFWVAFCPDAKIFRRIHDQLQLWDLRSLSWAVPETGRLGTDSSDSSRMERLLATWPPSKSTSRPQCDSRSFSLIN